jgi:hypothetical protein
MKKIEQILLYFGYINIGIVVLIPELIGLGIVPSNPNKLDLIDNIAGFLAYISFLFKMVFGIINSKPNPLLDL